MREPHMQQHLWTDQWYVPLSPGYFPHMGIMFIFTEALRCFPTESQPAQVPKTTQKRDKEWKTLQRDTSIYVPSSVLSPKPRPITGAAFYRVSAVQNGPTSKTRPTMCTTLAEKMNKTLFLYSQKHKRLTREIINYKAPITHSKSGIKSLKRQDLYPLGF